LSFVETLAYIATREGRDSFDVAISASNQVDSVRGVSVLQAPVRPVFCFIR
jgi:hypothetical protein